MEVVLQQLRGSATAPALARALDASVELLVSTASLATTQSVVSELIQLASKPAKNASFTHSDLLARLKQATAVCFTPASKAEFLGYTLVQQIFRCLEAQEQQVGKYQEMLLDVFNGNHNMLSGVFSAVEGKESLLFARSTAGAQLALAVISPLCVRILIDAEETCETKLVLLHLLQRIAWQSGHGHVKFAVTRTLVAALELSPRRVGSVQSYRILVSVLVDLLVASDETPDSTKLIATTCEQIVARVRFFLAHQIGVLQLLQALVQLAEFGPDALWSSSFLFSCAHVVVTSCDSSLEKQLLLSAVSSVLKFGKIHDESRCRRVLVECLIIPLISVLPTHAEQVSPMLQLVMEMKAQRHYVPIHTMKIILRFIKRMNSVASMQSMALRLLYVVWERESRVYSRLEALLHQERLDTRSTEYDLVKMATIESLCKKDAELGVEYISHIQASLEDERVSVVAMAVNAIESLCKADCLDFYAAFKIIALKMKKKKLQCVEEPLFLERLCVFYALGAAETDANKRQAAKLLEQLWELTGSASASVRRSSFESLNVYSLMALGLSVQENRGAVIGNSDDEDDEDDVTEDDVSEKLDELVESLKSEVADGVRSEIEKLLARVLEHESTKLNSGNGRGQAVVSSTVNDQRIQQRISAVGTREMKKKFPSCREVIELYGAEQTVEDWDGFLLAYEEKEAIEYSSVKRKDKLVKLASQNVADMEANLSVILSQQVAPWEAESDDRVVFLRVQSLMEGWQAFMAKYVDAVDELSTLKLTIGASAEDGDQHFAEQIAEQIASQDRAPGGIKNERLRMIAVGALTGQLRDSKRWTSQLVQQFVSENTEKLSNRLSRAIEETKVFPNENHHLTALSAVVGLHLALGNRPLDSVKETMTEVHLRRLELVLLSLETPRIDSPCCTRKSA
ncbi:Armadillo-type fold [Globisporangium polare]